MTIHGAFRIGLLGGLGVLTAVLIGGAVVTLASIITYVGFALFLALGLDPIVRFLEGKKVPRWLAIVTVVAGVLGIVAGFILAVIPVLVEQAINLYNSILGFLTSYDSLGALVAAVQKVIPIETLNVQSTVDSIITFMSNPANLANIGGGVLSVGFSFANAALGVFLTTMLTIYLVVSLPRIKSALLLLVPATSREKFNGLADQVIGAVGQYVIGQGSQGLTNGILSFIVLSILGAHYPALFALIALMFSLIPLVGTITGSLIIVIVQLLVDPTNPYLALWMAIYYLVYLQVEAYVIGPMIMNRAVQVPGVVVIIAALAGGSLMGVLGAVVAIPLAASVLIIVREVIVPAQNAR
ncbi:MAG: AI-2E family transporter [Microbacteriaceae bacterium]